jgi:hypothetical protein
MSKSKKLNFAFWIGVFIAALIAALSMFGVNTGVTSENLKYFYAVYQVVAFFLLIAWDEPEKDDGEFYIFDIIKVLLSWALYFVASLAYAIYSVFHNHTSFKKTDLLGPGILILVLLKTIHLISKKEPITPLLYFDVVQALYDGTFRARAAGNAL